MSQRGGATHHDVHHGSFSILLPQTGGGNGERIIQDKIQVRQSTERQVQDHTPK